MRQIHVDTITQRVRDLCIDACINLGEDVKTLLNEAKQNEGSPFGKDILEQLIQNVDIATRENIPLCQDTGMAVFFLELGQDVHIIGGNLTDAINEGVRQGYEDGYLRKSVLDPLTRENTKDNTPAIIYTDIVPGNELKIAFAPKGFGSENMSAIKMLKPSDGLEGIKSFVLDTVESAGANPCPPIVLGIGIGGTMEKAALLAKRSLIREAGTPNPNPEIALLERELLDMVNKTGIGPQGLGGIITALAVHIDTFPTHIAGLPVAVNVQCHAARHKETIL